MEYSCSASARLCCKARTSSRVSDSSRALMSASDRMVRGMMMDEDKDETSVGCKVKVYQKMGWLGWGGQVPREWWGES